MNNNKNLVIMKEKSIGVDQMTTSKGVSFFENLKQRKEGISMISTVRDQVKNKSTNIDCICGDEMEIFYSTWAYHYKVGNDERVLNVLNAPFYKCKSCPEVVEDLLLYGDVEKAIEEEIFIRLNKRQNIPDEMDFSDFIKQ